MEALSLDVEAAFVERPAGAVDVGFAAEVAGQFPGYVRGCSGREGIV